MFFGKIIVEPETFPFFSLIQKAKKTYTEDCYENVKNKKYSKIHYLN